MKLLRFLLRVTLFTALNMAVAAALAAPLNPSSPATASEAAPRVQTAVETDARVVLHGNMHPLIQAAASLSGTDLGAVEDSLPAGRMLLLLQRSPDAGGSARPISSTQRTRRAAPPFTSGSPRRSLAVSTGRPIRMWPLSPPGWSRTASPSTRFMPGGWPSNSQAPRARSARPFRPQIHRYQVNGEMHLANATDPSVPAALAPVIAGLTPLNDFHPQPHLQGAGASPVQPQNPPGHAAMDVSGRWRGCLRDGAGGFCQAV